MILYWILSYLVGSFPTGYLIARAKGIKNIKDHGSGSIGATNVARVFGTKFFFLVFFIDFAKSFLLLHLLNIYKADPFDLVIVAILLLVGNSYSVFLRFSGGKGIATSIGILAALNFKFLLFFSLPWIAVAVCLRNIGIASLVSSVSLIFSSFFLENYYHKFLFFFIAIWCFASHLPNLKKFLQKRRKE